MQAIAYRRYGGPDVLELMELDRPEPKDHQVLIRVHAASVNPIDWRIRSGMLRWVLPIRFPIVPGFDVAGEVVATGKKVSTFQRGDQVFCMLDHLSGGGYAEYATASGSVVVLKPQRLTYAQAASVPLAAITALQCLRNQGHLQPGHRVLVNGASGGVGQYGVQIAKALGARVTGVCSGTNIQFVRDLGADHVIDYHEKDFTKQNEQYDIVFDAVGKSSFWQAKKVLAADGRYVTTQPYPKDYLTQTVSKLFYRQKARTMLAQPNGDDLRLIQELIDQEKVHVPEIDTLPLSEAAEAHRRSEAGHVRGKLVLEVAPVMAQ